jgi:acyl-CoA reductase-like NAD-dependent aldehyde dehydrogenase
LRRVTDAHPVHLGHAARGFKHSGYGKDLSMYGLEDHTRVKHVKHNLA